MTNSFSIETSNNLGSFRNIGDRVEASQVGRRLDHYLATRFQFLARSAWQKRILSGWVRVNGRQVKPSYSMQLDDDVTMLSRDIMKDPPVERIYPVWKMGKVMALHKPSGMPMHATGARQTGHLAEQLVEEFGSQWAAVHRLDKDTSGLVLCGADHQVRQALAAAFRSGAVQKEYLCIARGSAGQKDFIERGPIGDLADSSIRIKKWVVEDGQPAETHFRVVARRDGKVALLAQPMTGRTNQIRIHAAYNGLPLLGDLLFHEDERHFDNYFRLRRTTPEMHSATGFHRLCLHAYRVRFNHPESRGEVTVECPLNGAMADLWQTLTRATIN